MWRVDAVVEAVIFVAGGDAVPGASVVTDVRRRDPFGCSPLTWMADGSSWEVTAPMVSRAISGSSMSSWRSSSRA